MTRPDQLTELLERVERAEGPDHNIDEVIYSLFHDVFYRDRKNPNLSFTASLDAAIAFTKAVLPGWWRNNLQQGDEGPFEVEIFKHPLHIITKHKSEPLAVIAATLKALIAKEKAAND